MRGCTGLIALPLLFLCDAWRAVWLGLMHGPPCPACGGSQVEATETPGEFKACSLCGGVGRVRS